MTIDQDYIQVEYIAGIMQVAMKKAKADKTFTDHEMVSRLSKELTQLAVEYKLFDIVNKR